MNTERESYADRAADMAAWEAYAHGASDEEAAEFAEDAYERAWDEWEFR